MLQKMTSYKWKYLQYCHDTQTGRTDTGAAQINTVFTEGETTEEGGGTTKEPSHTTLVR